MLEDDMFGLMSISGGIALGHILAYHRIITAALAAGKLKAQCTVVHIIHLDRYDALKLLDAALHLYGLGGLITEPVYEGLDIGYLLLLILIGPQLLLTSLSPQVDILVILYLIIIHAPARYLQGAIGHIVDESTVMAHQHHGTCPGA